MEENKNRKEIYSGQIIKVYRDTVKLPNGKFAEREIVLHNECSAVLPIQNGKIILVRQYRYPIKSCSLEIPAGIMENEESPQDCAYRELREETGLIANNLSFMFKIHSSIGFCNELVNVFFADDLLIGSQNFDDDEFITIEKYSLDEVLEMIKKNKITDGKTVCAIFAYISSCK